MEMDVIVPTSFTVGKLEVLKDCDSDALGDNAGTEPTLEFPPGKLRL